MNKKTDKKINQIYEGFSLALKEKPYNKVRVEDILIKCGVSRSTFYSYFKTKEDLLDSITKHIFEHVFSHSLSVEKTHDYSKSNILDYDHLISHTLYHLRDEGELIREILKGDSRDIFIKNIKEKILPISKILKDSKRIKLGLPDELVLNFISETFIVIVDYWFNTDFKNSPEEMAQYFFELCN